MNRKYAFIQLSTFLIIILLICGRRKIYEFRLFFYTVRYSRQWVTYYTILYGQYAIMLYTASSIVNHLSQCPYVMHLDLYRPFLLAAFNFNLPETCFIVFCRQYYKKQHKLIHATFSTCTELYTCNLHETCYMSFFSVGDITRIRTS